MVWIMLRVHTAMEDIEMAMDFTQSAPTSDTITRWYFTAFGELFNWIFVASHLRSWKQHTSSYDIFRAEIKCHLISNKKVIADWSPWTRLEIYDIAKLVRGTRKIQCNMMTSSNGSIFRLTGHLCGEFTGPRRIPRTKASDEELWCFVRYAPE